MHDIWEPSLNSRINRFISRKAQEFPELGLRAGREDYTFTPRKRYFGESPKKAL